MGKHITAYARLPFGLTQLRGWAATGSFGLGNRAKPPFALGSHVNF
jgi:hypothetical protein